jgi:hypothetical protein
MYGGKATFSYIEAYKPPQKLEMEIFVWEENAEWVTIHCKLMPKSGLNIEAKSRH